MSITKKIAINTLGFLVIAWFVPQFYVTNWVAALVASIVLAVLNLFVKPILFLLTLPVTIVTFGCFSFVLNAMMLSLTSLCVGPGFTFASPFITLVVSVLLTIFQRFVENLVDKSTKQKSDQLVAFFCLDSISISQPLIGRYCILQGILLKHLEYLGQQVVQ